VADLPYGGLEAGGTNWVCAVGTSPDDLRDLVELPTTSPEETLRRATDFFRSTGEIAAVGVGAFGPIDVRPFSPTWGRITTTPKPGWANTDVGAALTIALGVPVALDTDVNAAALGELRWGAAAGLDTFCYVTVGTGIGGSVVVDGRPVHGLLHPELGHMRIPHDRERDPFDGVCPYHANCWEGLASGEALRERFGRPAEELEDEAAWRLEADYLALGLANVVCALSPERLVVGGGVVVHRPALLDLVRVRVDELLAGYVDVPEIVPPALGDRAGVLGALELARRRAVGT
jgi:fructokinase